MCRQMTVEYDMSTVGTSILNDKKGLRACPRDNYYTEQSRVIKLTPPQCDPCECALITEIRATVRLSAKHNEWLIRREIISCDVACRRDASYQKQRTNESAKRRAVKVN